MARKKLGGSGPEANSMHQAHRDMMDNRSKQIGESKAAKRDGGRAEAAGGKTGGSGSEKKRH